MTSELVNLSNINWEALYKQQSGGNIRTFTGTKHLRGGGLGGILLSAIPALIKMLPSFLSSSVGKEIVNSGASIVNDLKEGVPLKEAAKTAGRKAIRNMTGIGKKRVGSLGGAGKRKRATLGGAGKRAVGAGKRKRASITVSAVGEDQAPKGTIGIIKPGHSVNNTPARRLHLLKL
jgi:hypothetical protein